MSQHLNAHTAVIDSFKDYSNTTDIIPLIKKLGLGTYNFRVDNASDAPVSGGVVYKVTKTHWDNDTRCEIVAMSMSTSDTKAYIAFVGQNATGITWHELALNSDTSMQYIQDNQSLLAYAESLAVGTFKTFRMPGTNYSSNDLPASVFKWGTGFILKRLAANMVVVIFANGVKPAINYFSDTAWTGWKDMMWNNYS